jgi:hypothetical protein
MSVNVGSWPDPEIDDSRRSACPSPPPNFRSRPFAAVLWSGSAGRKLPFNDWLAHAMGMDMYD